MSYVNYTWPPAGPVTVQNFMDSYLYRQYNTDADCQALVTAYNELGQQYLDFMNALQLPIYTNKMGALLDWVGEGIYGYFRPVLPTGTNGPPIGPLNTWTSNSIPLNTYRPGITTSTLLGIGYFAIGVTSIGGTYYQTSDDGYQRCLTWHFYKGDGHQFNLRWLKRRVERFLHGFNGTDPGVTTTYDISVVFDADTAKQVNIRLASSVNSMTANLLQAAIAAGVLELPFQYTWVVMTNAF